MFKQPNGAADRIELEEDHLASLSVPEDRPLTDELFLLFARVLEREAAQMPVLAQSFDPEIIETAFATALEQQNVNVTLSFEYCGVPVTLTTRFPVEDYYRDEPQFLIWIRD